MAPFRRTPNQPMAFEALDVAPHSYDPRAKVEIIPLECQDLTLS